MKQSRSQANAACDLRVCGAPGPIRTADTRFRRAVLCPLSYGGALEGWLYDFFEELVELLSVLLPDEPSAANSTARLTLPLMFDMVMVLLAP